MICMGFIFGLKFARNFMLQCRVINVCLASRQAKF